VLSKLWSLLKLTGKGLWRQPIHQMAAALSFFALFALPPLVLVLIVVSGEVLGDDEARTTMLAEIERNMGPEARDLATTVIENTPRPGEGDLLTQILSVGALLFGATAGFHQLQMMLNLIWQVPRRRGLWRFLTTMLKRGMSFLLVIVSGILVLALYGTGFLADAVPDVLASALSPEIMAWLESWIRTVAAFVLLGVHLALVFKVLPDVHVPWRSALLGALLTTALFLAGKEIVALYLRHSNLSSAFGAAGSLVVTLIWVYAAALILLAGGAFSRAHADWRESLQAAAP
jgi:membrane protein